VSGIAALLHLDGRPVRPERLADMVAMLRRRGPDDHGVSLESSVGLGHSALHTTPEAADEQQPLLRGGLIVTADARLDDREALAHTLGLAPSTGDAALIAAAYERWGERCPERLEGDFAFAVWDRRRRRLFCARDRFGVRPLYVHHQTGRLFALASEPAAILVLEEVPYRINEARIADFLVSQLEGVDLTSTFFEEVSRLPPAHAMAVDPAGARQWRYWELEPGPELRLGSDEAYAEAFLEVFTEAVRRRLRGANTVGSMLSGGMDSGSVVAVARELRAQAGEGPLPVFSAIGPEPATCVETATILEAQAMGGLEAHSVNHAALGELLPELAELGWGVDEPFDDSMTLVRAVYLLAHRRGVKAVLDGIDGDTVLGEGSHLARLVRAGRWRTAWREAVGQNRFWGGHYPAWSELVRAAFRAFAPVPLCRLTRHLRGNSPAAQLRANIEKSLISSDFAERIQLGERLEALAAHRPDEPTADLPAEMVEAVNHPFLTVGVERYGRTAAALGLEPRHPFLDRRVVELCVSLPGEQKLAGGWPKAVLRRAMSGRLPEAVLRRCGRKHLGEAYTAAVASAERARITRFLGHDTEQLSAYLDMGKVRAAGDRCYADRDLHRPSWALEAAHLALWLRRHAVRPAPDASARATAIPHRL
jgi:asparagine synthase (glutamine-hydrolysing)